MAALALASLCLHGCTRPGADVRGSHSHDGPGATELRLAHNVPPGHPYDLAARRLAARVDSATNGAVSIRIFPSSQLGDTSEQLEGLILGTLDLSIAAFAFASEFVPELGLFGVPYLFDDARHFEAVVNGDVALALDSVARVRPGFSLIATLTSGERAFFNSVREVESIADLRGLKVRVMSGRADALTWQAFGAIPAPMPYSEVYSALQAGVIDGAENDPASILNNRFYESCRYLSLTNHMVLPMGIFAGERTRRSLSRETWSALVREARATAKWQHQFMEEQNAAAVTLMAENFGVVVSHPDRRQFAEHVSAVQEQVAGEVRATALLDRIRKAGRGE